MADGLARRNWYVVVVVLVGPLAPQVVGPSGIWEPSRGMFVSSRPVVYLSPAVLWYICLPEWTRPMGIPSQRRHLTSNVRDLSL